MKKRLFAVAAAALIPTLGLLIYNEVASRYRRTEQINAQAAASARLAASEIERILEGARSLLIAVSAIPSVNDLSGEGCAQTLNSVASRIVQTGAILLIDRQGKLVCDSQGHPAGTDFSDRPYVQNALQANDVVVGDYTISKLTGAAVLPIAMPIRRDDEVVGVLSTGIRLSWLQQRIEDRGVEEGGAVTIADKQGTIIARVPFPERFVGTRIPAPFESLLASKSAGTIEVMSQDGTERILGYEPITDSKPLYVSAGVSTKEAFAEINRATWAGVLSLVLSTLVAVFAAHWVGKHFILQPIDRIMDTLQRRRNGEPTARTGMSGAFELDTLGRTLDTLLDQLDQQREELEKTDQKRALLARELSHRVKNTLTIISALARQTFRQDRDAVETFSERIRALSGAYDLLLSGTDHSTDVVTLVSNALQPYGDLADKRCHASGPPAQITSDIALGLSLIIHELVTNAIKYGSLSNETGHVDIGWTLTRSEVMFSWHERGGPAVVAPTGQGFGSKLIQNALPGAAAAKIRFDYFPQGLRFVLVFALPTNPSADLGP
ncbi:sensor histidine kinase [Pararhizobium arenae]|uniref:sensor histidine kinase n=1 Tax=Pararhizobium arenae TaxID=1856850 RepID=UPI00094AB66A|nr:cache domain-containing protein [Pararhizobium arenae]